VATSPNLAIPCLQVIGEGRQPSKNITLPLFEPVTEKKPVVRNNKLDLRPEKRRQDNEDEEMPDAKRTKIVTNEEEEEAIEIEDDETSEKQNEQGGKESEQREKETELTEDNSLDELSDYESIEEDEQLVITKKGLKKRKKLQARKTNTQNLVEWNNNVDKRITDEINNVNKTYADFVRIPTRRTTLHAKTFEEAKRNDKRRREFINSEAFKELTPIENDGDLEEDDEVYWMRFTEYTKLGLEVDDILKIFDEKKALDEGVEPTEENLAKLPNEITRFFKLIVTPSICMRGNDLLFAVSSARAQEILKKICIHPENLTNQDADKIEAIIDYSEDWYKFWINNIPNIYTKSYIARSIEDNYPDAGRVRVITHGDGNRYNNINSRKYALIEVPDFENSKEFIRDSSTGRIWVGKVLLDSSKIRDSDTAVIGKMMKEQVANLQIDKFKNYMMRHFQITVRNVIKNKDRSCNFTNTLYIFLGSMAQAKRLLDVQGELRLTKKFSIQFLPWEKLT
jgi:hypothetical protein